jgi:hypothetical protein
MRVTAAKLLGGSEFPDMDLHRFVACMIQIRAA